jgi:hypothetical protein
MAHNRGRVCWVRAAETWSDLLAQRAVEKELSSGKFAVFKIKGLDGKTASQMARSVYKLKDAFIPDTKTLNTDVLTATLSDFETQKDKQFDRNAWHSYLPVITREQLDVAEVLNA